MMPETGRCFVHFKALTVKTYAVKSAGHAACTDGPSTKNPSEPRVLNRGLPPSAPGMTIRSRPPCRMLDGNRLRAGATAAARAMPHSQSFIQGATEGARVGR